MIPRLRLVHQQRHHCRTRLEALLKRLADEEETEGQKHEHRDVQILRSLPGAGSVVTATMLAEASQPLAARDDHAVRAHGGVAPVTRQSGKRTQASMRHGGNIRLRNALDHWARVSTQVDPESRAQYAALRSRGHSPGRALRSVAGRLLRILMAMLRTSTFYDPNRSRRALAGDLLPVPIP